MLGVPADLLSSAAASPLYHVPTAATSAAAATAHLKHHSMRRLQSNALFRLTLRGGAGAAFTGSCWEMRSNSALAAAAAATAASTEAAPVTNLLPGGTPPTLAAWAFKTEQGILRSGQDNRAYRWLYLSNGLKVLLVHDDKADKAAAAMSVDVGAAKDPAQIQGLAHFTEHMLFLGTEKFPIENAYKSFLAKHGGRSNASTSMDATVYQFEVGAEHLAPALDIFAQFFVAPLFSPSATEREMRAVDSEDSKNRTNDDRRILQVLKALADPAHSYSKYSTGNIATLRDDVPAGMDTRSELLKFHTEHYHAHNMALTVLGKGSLDELEALARSSFDHVRPTTSNVVADVSGDLETVLRIVRHGGSGGGGAASAASSSSSSVLSSSEFATAAYNPPFKGLPLAVEVEPLRDVHKLFIQWPMPPQRALWRSSPTRLLSHLWGSESPGSLFSVLQDRGLAHTVSAGVRTSHDDFSLFQVTVSLTEEGGRQREQVLQLVHQFSRLLQSMPDNEAQRHWSEVKAMSELDFRFAQEAPPFAYAPALARRLQMFPPSEILSAGSLLQGELDAPLLRTFLSYFTPENTLTWGITQRDSSDSSSGSSSSSSDAFVHGSLLASTTDYALLDSGRDAPRNKQVTSHKTERWYGVPYLSAPVNAATLRQWSEGPLDSALCLPSENPYIPDDFELVADKQKSVDGGGDLPVEGALVEGMLVPPKLLLQEAQKGQLWHKTDVTFKQPRTCMSLLLATPAAQGGGAAAAVNGALLSGILQKTLAQSTYAARIAGLSWGLAQHPHGLMLSVYGYSQKVAPLLEKVVAALLDPAAAAKEGSSSSNSSSGASTSLQRSFDEAREAMLRRYKSFEITRPDEVADYYCSLALSEGKCSLPEALAAAQKVTLQDVLQHHSNLLKRVYPIALVHGNVASHEALSAYNAATSALASAGVSPLLPSSAATAASGGSVDDSSSSSDAVAAEHAQSGFPMVRVGWLPQGQRIAVRAAAQSASEANSALVTYWQLGERSERSSAVALVLSQVMREPCFTTLRTQQQLGYIVNSGVRAYGRRGLMQGFVVRVLSKDHSPDAIQARVDAFISDFRAQLEAMPEEAFQQHVQSLIRRQMEPPKTMDTEFGLLYSEIDNCEYKWDRYVQSAQQLAAVTKADVLALVDSKLLDVQQRRRMDVMIYGSSHPMPERSTAAAAAVADAGSRDQHEEPALELTPEQLLEFRSGLQMLDTSLDPRTELQAMLDARGHEVL